MSIYDQGGNPGQAHGQTSPWRVDPSTVLALFVLAALAVIAGIHFLFRFQVGVSR